ncbi:helitron helicase-like domain-containing protein [Artemisia annua]|uniref:Helitron helicase-like domain-containing protein n=1 Tax=Artemisia annua TaxID=35608 RepID=A0A2U1Q9R6_ARTAN|nr:helitron helicase-like domain-containing protein [Artemisia annua]
MTVSGYVHCASETVFEASQQPSEVHVSDLLASNFERSIDATPTDSIAASSMPVQVMTVDGLVSTFEVTNVAPSVLGAGRCSPYFQGSVLCVGASTSNDDRHVDEQSTVTPMLLDFSYPGTPRLSTTRRSMHSGATRMSARQQRTRAGTRRRVDMDTSPVQGPIAPPQRQGCYIFLFFEFHFIRVFIAVLLSLSDLFRSYFSPGAPADYKSFGRCDQICQHCHAIFWLAEKRSGLPVSAAPQYQRCCAGGRAYLRTYRHYPAYITNLFSDRHFMDHIRAYNQMFAMTSFGATIDNSINTGRGPYVFRVSGQIYHFIGGFCPANDDTPRFLQMYIYDTEHEMRHRLSHFDSHERQILREDIVQGLIQFLDDNNALVHLFRTARDKLREADIPNFQIRLFGVVGANQYELPTADTIGAIVYEGGPESMTDYDVVIERHSMEPESVNKLHPAYMSLQFPLLFVYGEEGYHLNLTLRNSDPLDTQEEKKMTMKVYYAYQLCDRVANNTKFIEARVYRRWTAMKVPGFIATGFSCILLDKKGSAIQANADLKEKERFEHDLQLNCVYRIQGFGFEKTDSWGKTLDNDFTLCFGKHTRVDLLKDDDFPYHYFKFAAYNELGVRLDKKNPILTDYIGYIHNVEKVKEYGSATGNKVKVRNIALRNLNNNVVMFTLWNEKADAFEEDEYAQMRKPVILAVSSCYLKRYGSQIQLSATSATCYYFNPPIEEASELLAAYNQTSTQHPQLEVQTQRLSDWEQERTRNRVPLGTLLQIDPNTQQRVLFTQDAMILQVDTTYDWYYQKCSECGGKLDYGFVHGHCYPYGTESKSDNSYSFRIVITDGTGNATMTCFSPQTDGLIKDINTLLEEVAEKNPSIIPPQILALQNTRHVFQFRFAKPAGKGPPTFVLQKVMDHPPSILPASAEGPSSPSTVPVYTLTDSQATPPPATPVTAENTPADTSPTTTIPVTSIVRKELFKGNTDEESDPQHNNQKTQTASEVIPLSATSSATQGTPTNTPLTVSLPITSVIRKEASKNTTDKEGDP